MRNRTTIGAFVLALLVLAGGPADARAQAGGQGGGPGRPGVELGGLLMAGFRAEPEGSPEDSGFDLMHARLDASGSTGLGVEYRILTGFDPGDRDVELLDARFTIPVRPELRISAGQFKAPFSREALIAPGELQFTERAQGPSALAPLRQVGVELSGATLDRRLRYRAGIFNGEGRTAGNPDGEMLYAARVEFSRLGGSVQFYDELNLTVGANVAFSEDSARDVSAAGPFRTPLLVPSDFRGERLLLGGDLELGYRGFFLAGEYLRGEIDPDPAFPTTADEGVQTAEAGYVEGGYKLWGGLVDLLGRWDAYDPPAGGRRDFMVLGANIYPGLDARIGVEYAARLDDAEPTRTPAPGLTPPDEPTASPAPSPLPGGWADGQFILRIQTGF